MRHIFIINPAAGRGDRVTELMAAAKGLAERHGLDCDCILTKRAGHARETCRALAAGGGALRFYACGGDGTLNEVANGILGYDNAAMTCVPAGTGNDFLKNFGPEMAERFRDPANLWDGPQFPLDVIDCSGHAALTVACAGFDARVARDVHTYGSSRLLPGRGSYIASLAVNFAGRPLAQRWTVTVDGQVQEGKYILAACCNGRYYGGGFLPVPEARMDDGVMHTVIVGEASRLQFLQFVGRYARGEYRKLPREIVKCYTAREITIASEDGDIVTCLDGESAAGRRVTLRLGDRRLHFFGPAGCDPNATATGQAGAFVNNL